MKKILSFVAAAGLLLACDPVSEDISNGGNITVEKLREMSSVTVDEGENGLTGNVITCTTSAPVNAKWVIGGKEFLGNSAKRKMKVGDYTVSLIGRCPDGTMDTVNFEVSCQSITDKLERYWIYGNPDDADLYPTQQPFTPGAWDAAQMRFSDNEGKHLPYLSDEVYWGFKTLVFALTSVSDDATLQVHNGWWSNTYFDNINIASEMTDVTNGADGLKNGLWELQLNEDIAKDCARGNGGSGKDLQLLLKSGTITVNSVYYEE